MKKVETLAPAKAPNTDESVEQMETALKELTAKITAAKLAQLEPNKTRIMELFTEATTLVSSVRAVDTNYVPPFLPNNPRRELNEENILSFLMDGGKPIGDLNRAFKGGSKKVKALVDEMVSAKKLVIVEQAKTNGRGKVKLYTVPPTPAAKKK